MIAPPGSAPPRGSFPAVAAALLLLGALLVVAVAPTGPAGAGAPPGARPAGGVVPGSATGPGPNNNSTRSPSGLSFTVSFFASGLPGGTTWGVILNGTSQSSRSGEISFASVPEGSVAYEIVAPGDYAAQPSGGHLTVSGPTQVAIDFSGGGASPAAPLIAPVELELLGGIGAAGVAAVALLELYDRRRRRRASVGPPSP